MDEAIAFVDETGVDALAVAIGTVHGVYKAEPKLNIERLKEIKAAVHVPLVLHGGSGLSEEDLKACVSNGIAKVNIFTDLSLAAVECIQRGIDVKGGYLQKSIEIMESVATVARKRMETFGSIGKA